MAVRTTHAVTGAFGYSGKYIAKRFLNEGQGVLTLTNSPSRGNPFGERIRAVSFHFDEPESLAEHLRGVSVLYNTYWVRFNPQLSKCADAVGDVVITKDEIEGLMADLLYVDAPPAKQTVLTDWIQSHADSLGRHYTSELARRKDRTSAYRSN